MGVGCLYRALGEKYEISDGFWSVEVTPIYTEAAWPCIPEFEMVQITLSELVTGASGYRKLSVRLKL